MFKIVSSSSQLTSIALRHYPGKFNSNADSITLISEIIPVTISDEECTVRMFRIGMRYSPRYKRIILTSDLLATEILFKGDGTFEKTPLIFNNARLIEVIGWLK